MIMPNMKRLSPYTTTNLSSVVYCFFLLVFLFVSTSELKAQENSKPDSIFREKLVVLTDKSFYVTGEIVWLKIYALNDVNNLKDSISKVAYVELLNADNKPVLQAKLQLNNGIGSGSLQLPTSLNSGNYLLRGYTAWMENFSADRFFYSTISIVNPFRSAQFQPALKSDAERYDIHFFPESGTLVTGLENRMAFRIVGNDGMGVDAKGTIMDEDSNAIASFSTMKFGMGSFHFTPLAGKHYHATIATNNKVFTAVLPEQQSGMLLHIDDSDASKLVISVRSQPASSNGTAFVLIQNGSRSGSPKPILLQNGEGSLTRDKTQLPDGITRFTLLDADHQPVASRLYFKKPAQRLIDASTDKQVYGKRDKITVALNGMADVQVSLSMSVCLIDSLQVLERNSINTYLWLGSGLEAPIESPEYYFSDDKNVAAATENLMMTQRSKNSTDSDAIIAKHPNHFLEFEGHIVTGKVVNKRTGGPAANITTYLSVPGQNFRLAVAISNEQGIVRFNVPDFVRSEEIVVQTNQTIDSNYRIDILNPFSDKFADFKTVRLSVNEQLEKQLLQHSIASQVQNTYLKDEQNQFSINTDDTIPFFGYPDRRYFLDDYTRFTTMEEVLREYVTEVAPRKHPDGYHLMVSDGKSPSFDKNPLVLADGVPFFNMDTVISLDPLKIKSLSVVDRKYYYGPLTFYGIVSYASYKGDLDGINLDPNSLVMEYDGMQLRRKFYSPVYETDLQRKNRIPDFRNTLSWLPEIQLNAQEHKDLSFYSSDVAGDYVIVLEGITNDGKPVTKTLTFHVN